MTNPPLEPRPSRTQMSPQTTPAADRPPRTPRWVWVLGSVVGLFLLAVVVFFLAGGDHGGGGHGAAADNPKARGAFDVPPPAAETHRLSLDVQIDGPVRTTDFTLEAATEPKGAAMDALGAVPEAMRGVHG